MMRNSGWIFSQVWFAYLSLLFLGYMDNIRGPYFPLFIRDLQLSDNEGAWFFAATSIVAFFTSWYSGEFVRRWGGKKCLAIGILLVALSAFAVAFSFHLGPFLIGGVLFGFGFGLIAVAQNLCISMGVPERWRSRVLGGLHSIYGLAALVAPFSVVLFEEMRWDWRRVYFWASGILLLTGLGMLFASHRLTQNNPVASLEQRTFLVGKDKTLAFILSVAISIYLFGEISISSRLVLFLTRTQGMSLEQGSQALALFFLGLFLSRFLLLLFDASKIRRHLIFISLFTSFVLFSLGLWKWPLLLSICGFSMGPFVPLSLDELIRIFGERQHQAMSYTMAFFSLMVVTMHLGVGWTTQEFGIAKALLWGPAGLFMSLFLMAWSLQQRPGTSFDASDFKS